VKRGNSGFAPVKRLLLASNSTNFGGGYLDHCIDEISGMLAGTAGRIVFVPYAIGNWDVYAQKVRERFEPLGFTVYSVHEPADEAGRSKLLREADAIFIGGGNTFRLLAALYQFKLLDEIRKAVTNGACYIGASAGSNVAGPTIKTTNDMPIIYPPSFDALGLVPFNINPHYLDPDPSSTHMGETRPMRIAEFHELNDVPVIGLREGAMLVVDDGHVTLKGDRGARLFRKGIEPAEFAPGARMDFLM
jgi:dipeptidase E